MRYRIIEHNNQGLLFYTVESKGWFFWNEVGYFAGEGCFSPHTFKTCCEAKKQIEQWKKGHIKKVVKEY